MALWDRSLRWVLGILILSYAVAGGPIWFYILGIYLICTAGYGLCLVYSFFKFRTTQ